MYEDPLATQGNVFSSYTTIIEDVIGRYHLYYKLTLLLRIAWAKPIPWHHIHPIASVLHQPVPSNFVEKWPQVTIFKEMRDRLYDNLVRLGDVIQKC